MTMRRAMALNAVLDGCDLVAFPGELLCGSYLGKFQPEGDQDALADARAVLETIGGRTFLTHADHAAPDYAHLVAVGLPGLLRQARSALGTVEADRRPFLESVIVSVEGVQRHLLRWASATSGGRGSCRDEALSALAERPPETFHEALQLVFLMHTAYRLDDRYAMALGRLDQYLYPFYARDLAEGVLDREGAALLLDHLFAKLADRYDIQNVCVGGLTRDGADATNALSFLCVESVARIARPGGNLTARIHRETPSAFVRACADCMRGGSGFPAVYNDEIEVPALVAQGIALEDARDYCFVGCIEAYVPGKQAPWADSRFNLLRCVDLALRGGVSGLTGERTGRPTPEPVDWPSLRAAYDDQVRAGVAAHAAWVCGIEREADLRADELTSPLLSALTADCVARGLDVNAGGARYPGNHGIAGMGIGSTADALAAVKRFVFDTGQFTLGELTQMLDRDFVGFERERLRLLHEAPKYGNDDGEVDGIASEAAEAFCRSVLEHRTPSGGRFWGLMAANIQNVAAGLEVGATPDGRRSREPVSDAASPAFGRDVHGPTAVIRSIARLDYGLAPGGNVVNMKLHPGAVSGEAGLAALTSLIRTCFDLGGVQLQFNTVGRETLLDAMEHPERHADLVVRVSGFSAYFTRLDRAVQEDVLARTEHAAVG
jgi:formate C-acetyltransferase